MLDARVSLRYRRSRAFRGDQVPRAPHEKRFVIRERRQHQAGELGHVGAQVAADRNAVAVWEPDIQHSDVGLARRHAGECFGGRRRLAHNLEALILDQRGAHAGQNQRMIIHQQDFNFQFGIAVH